MITIRGVLSELYIQVARFVFWSRRNATYILVMGGPGAGKGTIAAQLAPKLGLKHFNMGAIVRREMEGKTEFGQKWAPVVASGKLIPDAAIMDLLKRELKKPEFNAGAILDGMPRTVQQAKKLRSILRFWGQKVDFAVYLDVTEQDLIERLSGRRTCANKSGSHSVNLNLNPPKVEGKCDTCGSDLLQRPDDKPEIIHARLEEFQKTFTGVREFYKSRVATIQSTNKMSVSDVIDAVFFAIEEAD